MKYLPLTSFEEVTSALNFSTPDCYIVGSCDVYTTKAAGSDKKLYKSIDQSLESRHQKNLELSASLSPPQASAMANSLNLSRSSPFGPLSQISSRRTFAYLIATMNASHPDYDFSHILRPTDFRKERNLKNVMDTIDTALYNMRPKRPASSFLAAPQPQLVPRRKSSKTTKTGSAFPPDMQGSQSWGPRMWNIIDHEMTLRDRTTGVYRYAPGEDPFDGEEGAIWSMHYFFFNKTRKRVCYLYLRCLSAMSHSPVMVPFTPQKANRRHEGGSVEEGADKRAIYWLGDRAEGSVRGGGGWEDDEMIDEIDEVNIIDEEVEARYLDSWGADECYADHDDAGYEEEGLDSSRSDESVSDEEVDEDVVMGEREKSAVRAMSEGVVETMEV